MPINFIHLKEPDFELAFQLEDINYVRRTDTVLWLHFDGHQSTLALKGESAEKVWQVILDNSICVYSHDEVIESPST